MKTQIRLYGHAMRAIIILLCILVGTSAMSAQYSIYSFAGEVAVKHAGKTEPAAADRKVTAADRIIIGQNSSVQILNARDSRIYSCDTPGEHTLSGIMIDAESESNASTLHRRMRIGRQNDQQGTMYVENGKVIRALDTFDPDATDLRIDPEALARFILASALNDDFRPEAFPASFACPSDGFGFSLTNGNDEPIYINIVKASRKAEGGYDISPLGQPVGSYVLLPGQTIARSQPQIPESYEKHILIATHYFCAIDDLVESLRKAAANPGSEGAPVPALPVFIAHIR